MTVEEWTGPMMMRSSMATSAKDGTTGPKTLDVDPDAANTNKPPEPIVEVNDPDSVNGTDTKPDANDKGPEPEPDDKRSDDKLPGGNNSNTPWPVSAPMIVGVIVGAIALLVVTIGLAIWWLKSKRTKSAAKTVEVQADQATTTAAQAHAADDV